MARVCDLTSTKVLFGNKVSHSNRKTSRKFLPNLHSVQLTSEALRKKFSLSVSTRALKTVMKKGGLDRFLIETSMRKLSLEAQKIAALVRAAAKSEVSDRSI